MRRTVEEARAETGRGVRSTPWDPRGWKDPSGSRRAVTGASDVGAGQKLTPDVLRMREVSGRACGAGSPTGSLRGPRGQEWTQASFESARRRRSGRGWGAAESWNPSPNPWTKYLDR